MKRLLTISLVAIIALVLSVVALPASTAQAAGDWYVNPGDSIQAAIDLAEAAGGGTVHVAAGTYVENITLKSGVEVLGAGQAVTTIDGGLSGSVVTATGVDDTAKLDGFTITRGRATNGAGIYLDNSNPVISNCTIQTNQADIGGGMYNESSSSPTVTNCILWEDNGGEIVDDNSLPLVTFSDIEGGYPGTGNINEDPLFADAPSGNLHLSAGSPCIDTGDNGAPLLPATDFEGDDRIIDGDGDDTAIVDMGADEFKPVAIPLLAGWQIVGLFALLAGAGLTLIRRSYRKPSYEH